jgi:heterodisulfide reductase subunit C
MRELPVVKVDGVVELDHAVIDGIDVSGSWNRMFTQRSITEYPTEAMDWVTGLDGGESMRDCYQCGKCVPVCPVNHVGDYGPRKLNVKVLRGNDLVDDPDLWLCTTCGACYRVCPKEVNPLRIMPAIREQAVLQGKVPDELADTFQKLQRTGNPLGESPRKRAEWSADAGVPVPLISEVGRPVDVLWYVSDYTSYHPRGKDAARAMARVLTALGVDFAILGPEERSDGDSARLAGESGLFEMLAEQNIRTFSKYEFQRLVVMDPHAYNAFRNHYPGSDGRAMSSTTRSSWPRSLTGSPGAPGWNSTSRITTPATSAATTASTTRLERSSRRSRGFGSPRCLTPARTATAAVGEAVGCGWTGSLPTTSRSGSRSAGSARLSRPSRSTGPASCRWPVRTSRPASRTPSSRPATTVASSSATSSS